MFKTKSQTAEQVTSALKTMPQLLITLILSYDAEQTLIFAILSHNEQSTYKSLAAGASYLSKHTQGMIALHLAAKFSSPAVLKAMLASNTDIVNTADAKGQTALHHAVSGLSLETTKTLLEAKADPSFQDIEGKVPYQHLLRIQNSNVRLFIPVLKPPITDRALIIQNAAEAKAEPETAQSKCCRIM